uniref:Uncharacterized protein n=1 Tax=Timema poppense TaxID=170557 RepID=A0A7R9D5G9_TIMPO|nr:unnamed protein product [Timema poppensis]
MKKFEFRGRVPAFARMVRRQPFRKKTPSVHPTGIRNPDLLVIGILGSFKSYALYHETTEAGPCKLHHSLSEESAQIGTGAVELREQGALVPPERNTPRISLHPLRVGVYFTWPVNTTIKLPPHPTPPHPIQHLRERTLQILILRAVFILSPRLSTWGGGGGVTEDLVGRRVHRDEAEGVLESVTCQRLVKIASDINP